MANPTPSETEQENLSRQAEELLEELFLDYRRIMKKWAEKTGQGAQLDSGYIAQHLVSLLTGKRGCGWRGKGLDLEDGSEVKSACIVDGVDVPRWNHNFASAEKIRQWLAAPAIYYVLFDYAPPELSRVRVRVWMVIPSSDKAYRTVLKRWRDVSRKSDNFQLHPPVNKDNNLTTNECGDLELPLIFHAEEATGAKLTYKPALRPAF